jgi:hypothetical protein
MSQVDLLRLAWKYGNRSNRLFVLLIGLGPSFGLFLFLPLALTMSADRNYDEALQVMLTGVSGIVTWGAFQNALYTPLYSPRFWEHGVRNGWVPAVEREYYLELARYQDVRGRNGQLPGDVAWGVAYFLAFLGEVAGSVVSVLLSYPILGRPGFLVFPSIAYPIAMGFWLGYRRRIHRRLERAERDGFRLLTLQRDMKRWASKKGRGSRTA